MDKEKIKRLTKDRAEDLISCWFSETPDIYEWQEEHDLTDEELAYAESLAINVTVEE